MCRFPQMCQKYSCIHDVCDLGLVPMVVMVREYLHFIVVMWTAHFVVVDAYGIMWCSLI